MFTYAKKITIISLLILCPVFILAADRVEINTASLQQLEALTGIGPVKAQAIVDARPFSSVDDLLRVKGIGAITLQKIKDQGLACVNCEAVQSPATAENSEAANNAAASEKPPASQNNAPGDVTGVVSYPKGIFINEILPNPEGADETDEWTELYNSNNFDADLSDWQIQDVVGTIKTYTIPQGTKILAGGFLVFKRPETKIMLNNDTDGIHLLTPDEKIVDAATFTSAPLGQSYNKIGSGWQWSTTLTPGTANIVTAVAKTLPASATQKALQAGLPKAKNSVKNDGVASGLADISQSISPNREIPGIGEKTTSPWFLFFTVLGATIILAIIVLLIKLRFTDVIKP